MLIRLDHATHYRFDRKVRLGPHLIRLRPAPQARAMVRRYGLSVRPIEHVLTWHHDPFGNAFARAVFAEPADRLDVVVELEADIGPVNPLAFLVEPEAEFMPFGYSAALRHDLGPFLARPSSGPALEAWLGALGAVGGSTVAFLGAIARDVAARIEYEVREAAGTQTAEETIARRVGSCRDSAWLLVELLRGIGIAARFVSGYLIELAPASSGASNSDRAELHAWCEAFVPGAGWIGLDGTSGLFAAESHLPLVTASYPAGAAPIDGTVEPCQSALSHDIVVRRLG